MPHKGTKQSKRFFAPVDDEERIKQQTQYEQIYLGKHRTAFNPSIPEEGMYIPELFGRTVTLTFADLLFGEQVAIVPELEDEAGKEFLKLFSDANPFLQRLFWDAAVVQSFSGGVVVEMMKEEESETPSPVFHDTRHWIPTVDAMGNFIEQALCFVIWHEGVQYVQKRVHTKGFVENFLFPILSGTATGSLTISEARLGPRVPMSTIGLDIPDEPIPTGVDDDFLVRHVPNMFLPGSIFGMSDYSGLQPLMSGLNAFTSFAYAVIEKHADPTLQMPKMVVDEENQAETASFLDDANGKAIEVSAEEASITKYVTWDAKLDALFQSRREIILSLSSYSEVAPGLLGINEDSLPESGTALRLRFARTLRKVQRKQRHWEEAILWILSISQKMLGEDPSSYSVTFSDGLPEEEGAFLSGLATEKDLGIKSEETIIREALAQQGFTEDMIEAELLRLGDQNAIRRGAEVGVPDIFERSVEVSEDGTSA